MWFALLLGRLIIRLARFVEEHLLEELAQELIHWENSLGSNYDKEYLEQYFIVIY